MKMYCCHDKVADRYTHFMLANTDCEYVREMVMHRVAFPLNFNDLEPLCLGEFKPSRKFRPVSWNAWRFPDSKAELLGPLGLSADELKGIIQTEIDANRERSPVLQSDQLLVNREV